MEPLCGVYGSACADPIRRCLDAADYRTTAFHHDVRVGTLPLEHLRAFGDPAMLFFNVNTPDDVVRAHALPRHGPTASS
jgi:molybdopterin-guanine dinucleotide biosynthesis protein A